MIEEFEARRARRSSNAELAALLAVLALALVLRLYNIGWGLPGLYDDDEPIFMLKSIELIQNKTLNPHWFGHPGTTVIYLLAVLNALVVIISLVSHRFVDLEAFISGAYADPALLFVPARVMMAIIATLCVALTYRVARRIGGSQVALLSALLLAVNGLHIVWSQVIRTDILASVFGLLVIDRAIAVRTEARTRDYILAGIATGFGIATKWPTACVFIAVIGAAVARMSHDKSNVREELRKLSLSGLAAIVALFVASPYLLLDWQTVVSNLGGEARPTHLSHTSLGFWPNMYWYLVDQVGGVMGTIGLVAAGAGIAIVAARKGPGRAVILPTMILFLLTIAVQKLFWSRWILPVLPIICIFAALGTLVTARRLAGQFRLPARVAQLSLALIVIAPSALGAAQALHDRSNDTRTQAVRWARTHIAAGSTVVVEHVELNLRNEPWHFLFPVGEAGCIDALKLLQRNVGYREVDQNRRGSSIVDLGTVSVAKLDSCRADYAILTYYDRYLAEAPQYPDAIARYRHILAGGTTVALFRPAPGIASGPIVRIVAIPRKTANRLGGNPQGH